MRYFENTMFNPQFVNSDYYRCQAAAIQNYQKNQSEHVAKAVHAFADMMNEIDQMDSQHQEQTFMLCLEEMATRRRW